MEKGKFVGITHFINPHLFWYQNVDGQSPELLEMQKIEESLQSLFPPMHRAPNRKYLPHVGEIVAIFYVSWNKFIRARVESICKYSNKENEYAVWSLDHGFPFQTKLCHIRILPEEYYKRTNNIRMGGIANILPAELEFDFGTMKSKIVSKTLWIQRAVEDIEKVINDAASISFIESFCIDGIHQKQHFGDLKIVNHAGKEFSASEYLIGLNYALESTNVFREKINTLQSIKIPCYQTNNREYKIKHNTMNMLSMHYEVGKFDHSGKLSESSCDKMFKQKVMDWNERNENCANMESLDRDLSCSTNTFDAADISFDDSISVTNYCNRDMETNHEMGTLNEEKAPHTGKGFGRGIKLQEDEMAMGLAGAQLKSRKTRYEGKDVPLPPSLDAFRINFEDKEVVSKAGDVDLNAVSSRTRALIELKKKREVKHLLKNKEEAAKLKVDAPNETVAEVVREENVLSERMLKLKQLQKKYCKKASSASDGSSTDGNVDANSAILPLSSRAQHLLKIRQKYSKQTKNIAQDAQSQSDSMISTQSETKLVQHQETQPENYSNARSSNYSQGHAKGYSKLENEFTELDISIASKELTEAKVSNPQDSPSPSTNEIEDEKQKIQDLIHSKPYQTMTLVPGGFDVTTLVKRRNEGNHWHTKKTTLNVWNSSENSNSCGKGHIQRRTEQDQDFRVARTRKERKKTGITGKSDERHLLDASLNDDLDCPPIVPEVLDTERNHDIDADIYSTSLVENLDKIDKLIDLSSVSDPKDNQLNDSFLKFVQEKNYVEDTSREQLIQSPNSNGVSEKEILGNVSPNSAMALITTELDSIMVKPSNSLTSISSSSFTKLESVTPNATNCNKDSYEGGSSSGSSGNNEKCQIVPKSKCDSPLSSSTESYTQNQLHPMKSNSNQLASSSTSSDLPQSTNSEKEFYPIKAPRVFRNNTKSSALNRFPILSQSSSLYSQTMQINETLPDLCNEVTHKTNLIEHLVLAHSNVKVTPIAGMSSALFTPEIHQEMEKMRLTKMYRIQSYAWAHLVRGNSFFVINSQRSGKTWCYLPALCSMVCFRLESNGLPQTYGPVAVILAPSSCQVESISRQCRRLLTTSKIEVTTVPSYGIRNAEVVKIELLNGCGILVITPPSLNRLLIANERENLFNMDRVQYLVIDEFDTMMSQYSNFDETLNKFLEPVLNKQKNGKVPFQMVVTSKRWSSHIISLLRISNQPLLCIADYLEAAVYSKAKLSIRLQGAADKRSVMLKCLKKCSYKLERVLIVCNTEDEVDLVEKSLIEDGYVCLTYTNRTVAEYSKVVDEWKVKAICNQILVVTDSVLPEVMIQNVWTLIHYSLPTTWTKFNFRFSCCLSTYENALTSDFAKPTKVPQSIILLDEDNNLQLPRLVEFMEHHHQLKHVHPDILNVSARITARREEARVEEGILMCPKILEYGACDQKNRCPYRHQLTKYDGPVDGIPTKGDLRVKILEVLSPTHYTARLLTHKQDDGWKIIRRSDEVTLFLMQLSLHFMNEEAQVIHWPLKVNDLCVYKGEDTFHRCRLLEVPFIPFENIVKQVNVKVKLIDSGSSIMCKSLYLLVIPDKFRDFPAQAVDMRLSGVIPFDNDRTWDTRSTRTVKKWIITDVSEVDCLQACITFALMNTIWVDNVILMEKLTSIRGYAIKTNLRRSLLGKNFGFADNTTHLIKKDAIQLGLLNSPEEKTEETPGAICEEEQNLLEFSSSSISAAGADVIHTEQTLYDSVKKPVVALAKEATIDSEKITEDWMMLKLDELLQVKISQLNDPLKFYLRLLTDEGDVNELAEIIQVHNKIPLDDPHPMQNCLAPLNGQYYRAKIRRLIIDWTEGFVQAMVFFCDLGLFKNIPVDQLRCSSKELVEHSPFQAICCKLTGIRVESVGEEIQKTIQLDDSLHFAYAIKETIDNDDLGDEFYIRNYEIILYECSSNKNDIMINKLLVERGLASYDDDTKHFLELEQNFDNEVEDAGNTYDFQEFLNRIQQQMEEEDCDDAPSIIKEEASSNNYEKLTICEINLDRSIKNEECDSPDSSPPPLRALHKRPLTTWYETMCMIYLVINAPDIADYHLEVTPKRLVFAAIVNGEKQVLILDFLGYVQPDRVTHEIRGLNVVVRLVKSLYMEWPRLLQDPRKFPWLTYNFNAIDAMEAEKMIEGKRHGRSKGTMMYDSSDSSVASNYSNQFETFTPINNADDLQDPMEDFY